MKRRSAVLLLICAVLFVILLSLGAFQIFFANEIATSHIEANVPKGKLFGEYLQRDLNSYFCGGVEDCNVDYVLLREGPTQTGIAYPKYYLWVRCFKHGAVSIEGAVRAAAVDQQSFDVTHFLSRQEILSSRSQVASVFPAALVDNIVRKAESK